MQVRKLTEVFGVAVEEVSLGSLDGAGFSELHGLWQAHGAMLVRGQQAMSDAGFEAFSKRFGELDPPPNQGVGRKNVPGFPDLYVVSNEVDAGGEPLGALGYSEAAWHTDMSYLPVPPIASMLLARRLRWRVGDVLIYKDTVRRMHRSQIKGTAAPVAYFQ